MRAELAHHLDLVVVIWVLALAVGFSVAMLTHSQLSADQWTYQAQGPVWVYPGQ
jgi:hypothetical protein